MQAAWSTRVVHARRWEMHGRVRSVAALADESSGTGSRPLHAAATRAKGRANGRAIYSSSSSRAKEKVNETDALFFFLRTALVGRTLVLWPCCPCLPILSYSPRRTREPTRGDRAHLRGDQPNHDALASACPNRQQTHNPMGRAASGLSRARLTTQPRLDRPASRWPVSSPTGAESTGGRLPHESVSTAPMEGAPDHHRRGRLPQIFSFGGSTVPPRRYTAVAAAVTPHG